mgnify:CR=1 FL=1
MFDMDKQFHLFQITTVDPYDPEQTEPRFELVDELVDLRPDQMWAKRYHIKLAPTTTSSAHNICGSQTQLDTQYVRRIYYEPLPTESEEEDDAGADLRRGALVTLSVSASADPSFDS